jgi:hypothetical protein
MKQRPRDETSSLRAKVQVEITAETKLGGHYSLVVGTAMYTLEILGALPFPVEFQLRGEGGMGVRLVVMCELA